MLMSESMPVGEMKRQAAVDRIDIPAKRRDTRLQQVVERAVDVAGTQIGAISIIDRNRQWLVARHGPLDDELPRAISFCATAIHRPGEPLIVPDATRDQRFASNPLVSDSPFIRFYVGMPLVDSGGYPLGALCVIDSKARHELPDLYDLAALAREAERILAQPS